MKKFRIVKLLLFLLLAVGVSFGLGYAASMPIERVEAKDNDKEKCEHNEVVLCHHNEGKKGYKQITVDDDAVFKQGHTTHQDGQDIIPPFKYLVEENKQCIEKSFDGLNWDSVGQAIWKNGCKIPGSNDEDILGCTDEAATNYDPEATKDDESCKYDEDVLGCTDETATNYDPEATKDDESCEYEKEPDPDPESLARKNLTSETRCDGRVYLRFTFKEDDGSGADQKTVKFTYNNQTKETKTDSDGRARVDFAYAGEMQAKAEFDGQSKTTNVVAAENCGEVLGTTTGQVLGASTMAATGTFASSLYSLAGIAGMALTAVGMKRYGKKN
jgi:hypothetical protein